MGDGAESATPRYRAFISYSHKDAALGRWLHRRLEGYRLPRRLAGSEGEFGPVPARLTPIFRDREELPAAGDLSEKVRAALAESASLIVVCSPSAAASPWVAKEIATFRALHPDRPILAAIVESEPAESFPPPLTGDGRAEPLAADLRPGRDGRRLGLLKLVAGLSGVGLDALVQRDAQRRVRRVTYVTAAALAAVLIMAVLTVFALNQRREAERQRADAEGLVEFMLTDLRDRLRGVGRIDVMQAVNERALDHYRRQGLRSQGPDALQRRARILHAMAEDDERLAQIDQMLAAAQEAHRISAALRAARPHDQARIYVDGQSEYWIGRAYELRQEWKTAGAWYGRYSRTALGLVQRAPENPRYIAEAAYAATDLGQIQLNGTKDPAAAEISFRAGISWFDKALLARPGDMKLLREKANAYAWLADSFYARRMWPASLQARLQQLNLSSQLSQTQERDVEAAYRLASAQRAAGVAYDHVGRSAEARSLTMKAYYGFSALTRHDPRNVEWLLQKAFVECQILYRGWSAPTANDPELRLALTRDVRTLKEKKSPRASYAERCADSLEKS